MSNFMEYDHLYKLLLIGDSGVGKSTLLTKYVNRTFITNYISTIGVDFKVSNLEKDGKKFKLQIWDTAGQERFRTITTSYYRGAHCCIIVFDLMDIETFYNVRIWIDEAKKYSGDTVQKILVGTKKDLVNDEKNNISNEAKIFAKLNDMPYMETSAKEGTNVDELFNMIVDLLYKNNAHDLRKKQYLSTSKIIDKRQKKICCSK